MKTIFITGASKADAGVSTGFVSTSFTKCNARRTTRGWDTFFGAEHSSDNSYQ